MAVAKQKEVEEHRRQQQQLLQLQCAEGADGSQAETGQQVQKAAEPSQQKSPSPYAKPSLGRCHRSISMPSQVRLKVKGDYRSYQGQGFQSKSLSY